MTHETPQQMANRIERQAALDQDPDSRAYGLAMASIIRKKTIRGHIQVVATRAAIAQLKEPKL